jgi:hypothetical protein
MDEGRIRREAAAIMAETLEAQGFPLHVEDEEALALAADVLAAVRLERGGLEKEPVVPGASIPGGLAVG